MRETPVLMKVRPMLIYSYFIFYLFFKKKYVMFIFKEERNASLRFSSI